MSRLEHAELLKIYVWDDELKDGRPLHEVIVDRVKELDGYGLTAVRGYSGPAGNSQSGGPQIVVKVLGGPDVIDLVQRFVRQLGSSGWMIREKVEALCGL